MNFNITVCTQKMMDAIDAKHASLEHQGDRGEVSLPEGTGAAMQALRQKMKQCTDGERRRYYADAANILMHSARRACEDELHRMADCAIELECAQRELEIKRNYARKVGEVLVSEDFADEVQRAFEALVEQFLDAVDSGLPF